MGDRLFNDAADCARKIFSVKADGVPKAVWCCLLGCGSCFVHRRLSLGLMLAGLIIGNNTSIRVVLCDSLRGARAWSERREAVLCDYVVIDAHAPVLEKR